MMKLRCLVFMQVIEGERTHVFREGESYDVDDALSLRLLTDHGDNFAVEIGDDVSVPEDSVPGEPEESEENAEVPAESEETPKPITAAAYESAAEDVNESVRRARRRS